MVDNPPKKIREVAPELWTLVSHVCNDELQPADEARLESLLRHDPQAREFFGLFMSLHAELMWHFRGAGRSAPAAEETAPSPPSLPEYELPWEKPRPKVVIETSPPRPIPWYSIHSTFGLHLIAHTISAILLLIGIGIASVVYVTHSHEIAATRAATCAEDSGSGGGGGGLSGALAAAGKVEPKKIKPKKEEASVVGYISGMVDCRWADPSLKPITPLIRQGTKFALASGLMEITYTTGAKVILQGPCTYEVESPHGGYLALGKLAAKVEPPKSDSSIPAERSRQALQTRKLFSEKSLFAVRTPTAIITDLGTEFGVEVLESGESQAHVFQGQVEVRLVDDGSSSSAEQGAGVRERVIVLGENQSAVVTKDGKIQTTEAPKGGGPGEGSRIAAAAGAFVRQMPHWAPLKVFNTGIGLKEGDPDPHWQLVARSDQPDFKPQPAVVTKVTSNCLPNNPVRSQWLSLAGDFPPVPDQTVYTFRTTFELDAAEAKTATLRGRFLADNHVDAIRLNGRKLNVPFHDYGYGVNFFAYWVEFRATEGFVEGPNTLEFDVYNGDLHSTMIGPMALRVELEIVGISSIAKRAFLSMPAKSRESEVAP